MDQFDTGLRTLAAMLNAKGDDFDDSHLRPFGRSANAILTTFGTWPGVTANVVEGVNEMDGRPTEIHQTDRRPGPSNVSSPHNHKQSFVR